MFTVFNPGRILLEAQIKKYSSHIGGRVLDIGSGKVKRYASFFTYDEYITLDIDPGNKPDILASAEKIPLNDNSIDSILCIQVLGDIKEISSTVSEFNRILKPGGVVLLSESLLNEVHGEPNDFWRFTNFGLKYIFEKIGFEVIEIDQRGGFFSSRAQLAIRYLIDRFNLYGKRWFIIFEPIIKIYGKFMLFLDTFDKSRANRKHAIGWCILAKKK